MPSNDESSAESGWAIVQSPGVSNRRLGPHQVPRIECGKCGTSHHYDAAAGEYLGRCRECSAFLRRPTEEEHDQFTDFLVWNSQHLDRENEQTQLVTDGGEEVGSATTHWGLHCSRCGDEYPADRENALCESCVKNIQMSKLNEGVPCERCDGEGWIYGTWCDIQRAMNGRDTRCPECHGTGRVAWEPDPDDVHPDFRAEVEARA